MLCCCCCFWRQRRRRQRMDELMFDWLLCHKSKPAINQSTVSSYSKRSSSISFFFSFSRARFAKFAKMMFSSWFKCTRLGISLPQRRKLFPIARSRWVTKKWFSRTLSNNDDYDDEYVCGDTTISQLRKVLSISLIGRLMRGSINIIQQTYKNPLSFCKKIQYSGAPGILYIRQFI